MMAESIPLRFAGDGRIARLRELRGRDEYAVRGMSTANAIALLASLLDSEQGKFEKIIWVWLLWNDAQGA